MLTASPLQLLSLTKTGLCLSSSPSISFVSKLRHGAKLCKQNKLGHFPIHAAAFAGAKKALEVILTLGMTIFYFFLNYAIQHIKITQEFTSAPGDS